MSRPDTPAKIAYLGPAGTWSHQACLDLFGRHTAITPLDKEALFAAYASGQADKICVPVITSTVGVTPYLDPILALPAPCIVAEYARQLDYSLLANRGATLDDIRNVLAHPIAHAEVKPWMDRVLPHAGRVHTATNGAAAQEVARSGSLAMASMGPRVGAAVYGLVSLADGIEQGPHNVTRWWVLGRETPAPTGHDKSTLCVETDDEGLSTALATLVKGGIRLLTVYERPSRRSLDTHRYVIDVAGHRGDAALADVLTHCPGTRVLGSYPRTC
ncbi:Prephenate dehydratase [plant metagenome]|uniref:Prephenate dehydratase n=1 Tax=plant metagenome TaxID=1297885 RepID=A0A484UGX6_9ZZZZ